MLTNLIAFDLKNSARLLVPLHIALLIFTILGRITLGSDFLMQMPDEIFALLVIFYVMMVIVVGVISSFYFIYWFYKNLFTDEGYLMHTLPVKPWQLITAKGVSALIIVCASVIVSILSIMILAGTGSFGAIVEFCDLIREMFREEPKVILVAAEFLVLAILSLLKSIYQIYASLSIGQLAGKHRILLSLGAYVGINIVITVLAVLIMMLLDVTGALNGWSSLSLNTVNDMLNAGQAVLGFFAAVTVIQLAAFHVITERILSLRLNLQ